MGGTKIQMQKECQYTKKYNSKLPPQHHSQVPTLADDVQKFEFSSLHFEYRILDKRVKIQQSFVFYPIFL